MGTRDRRWRMGRGPVGSAMWSAGAQMRSPRAPRARLVQGGVEIRRARGRRESDTRWTLHERQDAHEAARPMPAGVRQ